MSYENRDTVLYILKAAFSWSGTQSVGICRTTTPIRPHAEQTATRTIQSTATRANQATTHNQAALSTSITPVLHMYCNTGVIQIMFILYISGFRLKPSLAQRVGGIYIWSLESAHEAHGCLIGVKRRRFGARAEEPEGPEEPDG